MDRRRFLTYSGVIGISSLLTGCSQLGASTSNLEVTVRFEGDAEPDVARTLSLTIGSYSVEEALESGTSPPEWNDKMAFQALYRLEPGEEVSPSVLVDEPGQYRLDLWVEQRGSIGTEVEVTGSGSLSEPHSFTITDGGINHNSP